MTNRRPASEVEKADERQDQDDDDQRPPSRLTESVDHPARQESRADVERHSSQCATLEDTSPCGNIARSGGPSESPLWTAGSVQKSHRVEL